MSSTEQRSVMLFMKLRKDYRIFRTIRCTYSPLIFSKMEPASYNPVRLMCGSGCALSPSSEQILCCNKPYQRNSTYLNAFYLESNLLFSSLRSSYLLSFPLQVCFSSSPTLVPFTSVSFFSLYVRKHTRASRMYCNMYGS